MRWMRFCSLVLLCALGVTAWAGDWPQWLGPQRDSVWREDGIVQRIPKNGLPVLWRTKIGLGYAGPAVADGRVYVLDYLLKSGKVTNNPDVRDKTTGKDLWTFPLPRRTTATPLTYIGKDGRQYVVIATGNGTDAVLLAFALPGS